MKEDKSDTIYIKFFAAETVMLALNSKIDVLAVRGLIKKLQFLDSSEILADLRHDCYTIVKNDVSPSSQKLYMLKSSCVGVNYNCRMNILYFYENVKKKI